MDNPFTEPLSLSARTSIELGLCVQALREAACFALDRGSPASQKYFDMRADEAEKVYGEWK